VSPSPPDLEVTRTLDRSVDPPAYRAAVRVRTKPGAPVARVDLHRVRVPEAAVELDTMGPPLARIEGSVGPYEVTGTDSDVLGEAQAIGTIVGLDPVEGSWRRVFYRAVAWAGDDAPRGLFGGRSKPSALREVIVPPATPPNLAALNWHWPGGGLGDAQIDGSTLAPLEATPLGDHRLRADVLAVHPDGSAELLFRHPAAPGGDDRLATLGTAPPAPGANGLWRTAGGVPGQTALHLLARRASFEDRLQVRLLLTDPLGRATEQVLEVPAGSPLMEPNILTPHVTKRLNVGFVVDFVTTVPLTTQAGPYRLQVNYAVDSKLPPLLLQKGPGAQAAAGARVGLRPQFHRLDIPLPDIPAPPAGTDIFTSTDLIPVQRGRAAERGTLIVVGMRGSSGKVELKIVCPDGREAKLQLTLS
jgi:hypothetical protein